MNSKEYWEKREAEALKIYIKDEAEYSKELDRIYADMLDGIQKEIDSFYQKYASAEGITLAEAKKRVSKLDIEKYERKAKKYVKEASLDRKANGGKTNFKGEYFSEKANEEMRLYNATMKINRLEMLKANIGLETIKGHAELESFMQGILKGRTEEELARQAGILGKTVRNNAKLANAIVNGSFKVDKVGERTTFSDRIWQYHDEMKNELSRLLSTGLIQGKNSRAIMKDLKKYWYGNDPKTNGGARYCMERLMRTELARVQTEAQKQSFVRNGFEMYEFHANHGCCDICSGLDGKHFKVEKMMPGENAPPMHPHCRCSTSAYEDSEEYEAWLDHLANGGTTEQWNKIKYKDATVTATKTAAVENIKTLSNIEEGIEWANEDLASHLELCRGLPQKYHAPFDTFERETPKWMSQMSTALKKFDFATNTGGNAIVNILKDGKYKSIMETKTSNGHNDIKMRKNATTRLFSLYDDVDELKPSEFEKYGYLGTAERARNLYGDCRIVFKKDNLWDRTTFTIGDSLAGLDSGANRVPSFVSNPNIVSLGTVPFFEDMPSFNDTVINAFQEAFDSIEKHGYFNGQTSNQDYVELQFHGDITLDDIDYIEVPKNNKNIAEIQRIASEKGVEIRVKKR